TLRSKSSAVIASRVFGDPSRSPISTRSANSAAEEQIRQAFSAEPETIRSVPAQNVYVITFQSEAGSVGAAELERQAQDAGLDVRSVSSVSASFGSNTQVLALGGLGVAFLGMSVLVFAMFRVFVPSIAVVISAFSDIVIPLALMNVLGIE
ncbi:hypothetical protein DEQ92_22660, partial [Haloferax sp. Atlit-6N]